MDTHVDFLSVDPGKLFGEILQERSTIPQSPELLLESLRIIVNLGLGTLTLFSLDLIN